ncbi:heavy-metal-associated domain-containing protein [Cognatiluteimonas lumbrici]|uniref:heavy-metal-associated domain-containing protein n=1 Tax=Cognatiluteimonas lumbrici TaxID=2559601 RepID=UPI00112BFDC2|nr:heavy-metal-associated domain-containing protein [Luteimonas lumbrici]
MRAASLLLPLLLAFGAANAAEPETAILDVGNMTCPACRITIEAALHRDEGVLATTIDTEGGTVSIRFDPEKTSKTRLAETVTNAGFPAKPHDSGN